MILDVFHELQKAGVKDRAGEQQVFRETIEQAKVADEAGFGCWWCVEHHGAAEFSYSSAPEVVVSALAQHTKRLRFGHSGILAPFNINHPFRIAERAAVCDILSEGRLELGLARSGGNEWETFDVDPDRSRAELREALKMIPQMWTKDVFEWKSDLIEVPPRNIVPKPQQDPHPPLWQTCTSPESFEMAGELGIGSLATTLLSPLSSLRTLLDFYDKGLERCQPVGAFKNAQRSVFTFMHCAESEQAAIDHGAALHALWFVNSAPRVFAVPRAIWLDAIRGDLASNDPAATKMREGEEAAADIDDPNPAVRLLNRMHAGLEVTKEEAHEVLAPHESVVIGDPDQCREKIRGFREIGVDRLMGLMAFGGLAQEHILSSLRLTGETLIQDGVFNG